MTRRKTVTPGVPRRAAIVATVVVAAVSACGKGDLAATGPTSDTTGNQTTSTTTGPVPTLPAVLFSYSDASSPLPAWFLNAGPGAGQGAFALDNTPATNVTTDAGATLGRVLFYDKRLSLGNAIACASCHQQAFGFSDTARFSRGVAGAATRHTMALANGRFYSRGHFFWDERANTLEDQVLQPIQNPVEMGETLDDVVNKLGAAGFYGALFKSAFGSAEITSARISLALAQFVRSMVSSNSRFDQALAQGAPPTFAQFTAQEQQGQQLFTGLGGCAACHTTSAVVSDSVHDTGLDSTITDAGTGNGQFKAPSLRNVGARGPYMHDGRFKTLQDVVAFYDSGVQPNPNLDPRLRGPGGAPKRLRFTQAQRDAIVAYLNTLTDSSFLTAAKFSNPFPSP